MLALNLFYRKLSVHAETFVLLISSCFDRNLESYGFCALFVSVSVFILAVVNLLRFRFEMLYHVVIVRMLLVTHSAYLEMTITSISFISCDKSHRNIQN